MRVVRVGSALLIGLLMGLASAELAAQLMQLTDGTFATKAVLYDIAGSAVSVGGGTQYAEDAVHASGNVGNALLTRRADAASTTAGTDGDYALLNTDGSGRLWVNCGTGCSGGTQYAEDIAHTTGDSTFFVSGIRRDTTPSSSAGTAGDYAALNLDANGRLYVNATLYNEAGAALTLASDLTEDAAETSGFTGPGVLNVRRDTAASSAGTSGDYSTFNTDALGLLWTRKLDPCSGVAKTHIPINISTATTTELTAALAGASTHYYICGIDLVTAAANNVALTDDDTDNCASVTSGLAGGTTAASGWNFAANGGLTKGNGDSTIFKTGGTNRVICLVTSAATQLSGSIQVVAAP